MRVSLTVTFFALACGSEAGGASAAAATATLRRPAPPAPPPPGRIEDRTAASPSRRRPSPAEESHLSSHSPPSGADASSFIRGAVPLVRGGGASEGGGPGGGSSDDRDVSSAATEATASASPSSSSGEFSDDSEAVSRILSKVRRWMDEREEEEREREQESDSRPIPLPFITLSYAQTLDGMIGLSLPPSSSSSSSSSSGGEGIRSSNLPISGDESMVLTHALRSVHDAVLVGCGTMLADDPRLTVRLWGCGGDGLGDEDERRHQPRPVVLDTELRCVLGPRSGSDSSPPPAPPRRRFRARDVIVCCSEEAAEEYLHLRRRREEEGCDSSSSTSSAADGSDGDDEELIVVGGESWSLLPCQRRRRRSDGTGGGLDLVDVLRRLRSVHGIRSVMVEGGSSVLSSFVDSTDEVDDVGDTGGLLVDCVCVTISPSILGGRFGLHAFRDVGFGFGVMTDRDDVVGGGSHQMRRLCDVSFEVLGSDCVLLGRWPRSGDGRT